jgi:hypothetical protein
MKLTEKVMNSPIGLRITFDTAPVEKFHINATLPNPADSYRVDATITLPMERQETWLDGVVAAFQRLQRGMARTIRLDFQNVSNFFNMEQLERIDRKNKGFSMHIYGVPEETIKTMNTPKVSIVSASDFNRMYCKKTYKTSGQQKGGSQ